MAGLLHKMSRKICSNGDMVTEGRAFLFFSLPGGFFFSAAGVNQNSGSWKLLLEYRRKNDIKFATLMMTKEDGGCLYSTLESRAWSTHVYRSKKAQNQK